MKHFVLSFALSALVIVALALLRKPRTIIIDITTTGIIMATLSPPIGTTIALTGGAEVTARRQLVSTGPTE